MLIMNVVIQKTMSMLVARLVRQNVHVMMKVNAVSSMKKQDVMSVKIPIAVDLDPIRFAVAEKKQVAL